MEDFTSVLAQICASPLAWGFAALIAIKALISYTYLRRCPLANNRAADISPDEAAKAMNRGYSVSPTFLPAMLGGIALAVGGLYAVNSVSDGAAAALALGAMVAGVFFFTTEPARLAIRDGEMRVIAAGEDDTEQRALASDDLRASHYGRLRIEALIAAALFAVLYAYH